jgi:transcriptional/translational regulatory protein YebC/TACO1
MVTSAWLDSSPLSASASFTVKKSSGVFNKQGFISFSSGDEDQIMEVALDAGAQDVISNEDGSIDVVTTPEDFFTVKDALADSGLESSHAEVTMEPANRVELNLGDAEKFMKLIDRLEDLDDTQEVYHNADISDEVMDVDGIHVQRSSYDDRFWLWCHIFRYSTKESSLT